MKKIITTIAISLVPVLCSAADDGTFQVSGFFSQGLVKTTNRIRFNGSSDTKFGSLDRTEIGVLASSEISSNLDLRGMVSYIGDGGTDNKPRVVYALADIHTDSGLHGVRIGRYDYGYGFYAYAPNNPLYQDMGIPPQSIYKEGFRYMMRGDGVQLYTKTHLCDEFSAEFEIGYGTPLLYPKADINQLIMLNKNGGEFTDNSRIVSFNSTFNIRPYGIQIKYDFLMLDYSFSSPLIDHGQEFPVKPKNNYIGIRKYFDFGDLTFEYVWVKLGRSKWSDSLQLPGYSWAGSTGSNITYKHYLTDKLSLIVGYDQWYVNKFDPDGTFIEAASKGRIPSESRYDKSFNLGLSYRETKYTLRAEFHRVHGTHSLRASEVNILSHETSARYDIYLLSASYKF